MHDYKHYEAPEGAHVTRILIWLIISVIFAAIAYTSESDYQECMNGKSIALCGGGNTK